MLYRHISVWVTSSKTFFPTQNVDLLSVAVPVAKMSIHCCTHKSIFQGGIEGNCLHAPLVIALVPLKCSSSPLSRRKCLWCAFPLKTKQTGLKVYGKNKILFSTGWPLISNGSQFVQLKGRYKFGNYSKQILT